MPSKHEQRKLTPFMKKPIIKCPECGHRMEVGVDRMAKDVYCQCRNRNCSFDGWFADTYELLIASEDQSKTIVKAPSRPIGETLKEKGGKG